MLPDCYLLRVNLQYDKVVNVTAVFLRLYIWLYVCRIDMRTSYASTVHTYFRCRREWDRRRIRRSRNSHDRNCSDQCVSDVIDVIPSYPQHRRDAPHRDELMVSLSTAIESDACSKLRPVDRGMLVVEAHHKRFDQLICRAWVWTESTRTFGLSCDTLGGRTSDV